jgi:hypothetical protein
MTFEKKPRSLQFIIEAGNLDCNTVRDQLVRFTAGAAPEIEFQTNRRAAGVRGLDSSIIVALVSGTSAAVGALISGLLQVAREQNSGKIVLEVNGRKLEAPADTPKNRIDELVKIMDEMEPSRISVHL